MSTRTTVVVFSIVFVIAIFFVVVLPFFFVIRPSTAKPKPEDTNIPAIIDQGVFRSDDNGATWQQKAFIQGSDATIAPFPVNRLVQDPVDPETLYLATGGQGLWISKSRGDLWAPVADASGVLESQSNVLAVAVNPANAEEWFVAVFQKNRGRLLVTRDGGRNFREVYFTGLERFGVFDVAFRQGTVKIVTGQGGFLESPDFGRTWKVVRWFADGLTRLLVDPTNSEIEYVISSRGSIFRTLNDGGSWADVTNDLRSHTGSTMAQQWFIDGAGALYLGSNFGLLRSRDNGLTYRATPLIIPPDGLPVFAIAVDGKNLRRIMVSALNQLYGSEDDGESWAFLPTPSANRITQLLIDREDSKIVYAVVAP